MQAAILAGGLGVRLRPVTLTTPKPMVPINGRPFLEYQIALVRSQGFDDLVLLVGYLGEHVEAHFGDGRDWGIRIRYSYEAKPLGTAGAIRNAYKLLEREFLLLNGDTYLQTDYGAMLRALTRGPAAAIMAVYDNADRVAPNNVSLSGEGRVMHYSKADHEGLTHVDAGAYAMALEVVESLPVDTASSLESDVFPGLISRGLLAAWPVDQRFYDIGTFERLDLASRVLS
jgi:NDP-sugar pyrophosphorylase family protein